MIPRKVKSKNKIRKLFHPYASVTLKTPSKWVKMSEYVEPK